MSFGATPLLVVAAVVFGLWRALLWRRFGGDPVREAVVVAFFAWSAFVVDVTLFPMFLSLYDWSATWSLVPLASIVQLIRDTDPQTALYNIVGNLVLFVPFGLLLPLLLDSVRSLGSIVWRAAVVSLTIETVQLATQARSFDVDDVLLNTAGAVVGFLLFRATAAVMAHSQRGAALLERMARRTAREPLFTAAVPVGMTVLIVLPMAIWALLGATLSRDAIVLDALDRAPGGLLVGQADVEPYGFVMVSLETDAVPRLVRYDYKRVIPGRFTWVGGDELPLTDRSDIGQSITVFNSDRGEVPIVVVWGENAPAATVLEVTGGERQERLTIPPGDVFGVGFPFAAALRNSGSAPPDYRFRFVDALGNDVTDRFTSLDP